MKKKAIDNFVNTCSIVFKNYDFDVNVTQNKANLWHFSARGDDRNYIIYCAPFLHKVKGIIKIALKKIPSGARLVVISGFHSDDDISEAEDQKYCLVDVATLERFGTEMIEARERQFTRTGL